MPWFVLFLAGLAEVVWAVGLKYTQGFTRPLPSLVTVVFMVASILLLSQAMRDIPLGTAYAVWTGIGAVGTFIFGIILFGEAVSLVRVFSAGLIVLGLAGLKFSN